MLILPICTGSINSANRASYGTRAREAETNGSEMTYLGTSLVVVWLGVLLLIAGLYLNDIRLVLNNAAPGKRAGATSLPPRRSAYAAAISFVPLVGMVTDILYMAWLLLGRSSRMSSGLIGGTDPNSLSETGRVYLQRTIRHEWIMLGWIIGGFILMLWWLS